MKRARDEREPLDLDLPERKILLTAHGTVDRVITPERLDAHRLIEEFMILANVAAAETLERASVPLIYRVHDEPDWRRSTRCANSSRRSTFRCPRAARCAPRSSTTSWRASKAATPRSWSTRWCCARQAQAEYTAENYGHFGLNLRRYAHFTSPIRRYADLIVHRALIRAGKLGDGGLPESDDLRTLGEISAAHFRHRAARHDGRARDRRPADRAFPRRPDRRHLRGPHIGGVTRAGLFVKLDDTGADGFIPARTIGDEYFRYQEDRHALIGNDSRRNLSARRPRHGQAGRGRSGRRRAALRASQRGAL